MYSPFHSIREQIYELYACFSMNTHVIVVQDRS
jgi:hypothetical protein